MDNHPGYITWDDYLENKRILESNRARRGGTTRGSARRGPALLAGLLRCGRCGRKLFVAYSGQGGRVPRYACRGGRTDRGHASCLSLGGVSIERAVIQQVLGAIRPAGVEAALAALENLSEVRREKRRSLEFALEKARYEARRAQRQYDVVDPENRLVAGELESRWNDALSTADRIEEELGALSTSCSDLTEEQKQRLFQLGHDLPALWRHPSASNDLKKRILRTVLHEIVVDNDEERRQHVLQLHWQGGVHTALRVGYNSSGKRRVITDQTAIDLIRELSKVLSDRHIAATLNRLGYRTGGGKTWRAHSVRSTRYYYRLRNHRNAKEWLTIEEAAKELGVSHTVVRRLIRQDVLPAAQVVESTPWIIDRGDLSLEAVQAEVQAVHSGRQLRRCDPNQAEIAFEEGIIEEV